MEGLGIADDKTHDESWVKFRIVRVIFVVLVVAWIPYGRIISWAWTQHRWPEKYGLAFDLGYLLMLIVVGCCYALWPCPRCRKVFRGLRPHTGRYCYYCKLPKGT